MIDTLTPDAPGSKPRTASKGRAAALAAKKRRTQEERRSEAERRLLNAAIEVVAKRGTERMTLAEVGEAAGYSRGLSTHRFGSKAGLLSALAVHIGELYDAQLAAAPRSAPGLETIRSNLRLYFSRSGKGWTTTRALLMMMGDALLDDSPLATAFAAYNMKARAIYEKNIQAGIELGEIDESIDPKSMAVILVGACRGVVMQALLDGEIDLVKIRDDCIRIVNRTLSNPKA